MVIEAENSQAAICRPGSRGGIQSVFKGGWGQSAKAPRTLMRGQQGGGRQQQVDGQAHAEKDILFFWVLCSLDNLSQVVQFKC